MSFTQTTASNIAGVLSAIKTFATGDVWTATYDDIAGAGGVGAQLGLTKGNCALSIGEKNSTENPVSRSHLYPTTTTVYDGFLYMVVNHSLNASNKQFWGHPDGTTNANIVTTAADADAVRVNDLYDGTGTESFDDVFLFSDRTGGSGGNYVWCVTRRGARYTIFGFGIVDKKGMTHSDCAFASGHDYEWWANDASLTGASADWVDPSATDHQIGVIVDGYDFLTYKGNVMVFLKDAVVNPSLGFTDDDYQTRQLMRALQRGYQTANHRGESTGYQENMLNYFLAVDNQNTTGGQPMAALPVIIDLRDSSTPAASDYATYIGDFPGIRLINIANLVPEEIVKYGSEEWMVFPFKRKGLREETKYGTNPQGYVNSIDYGLAIQKIT